MLREFGRRVRELRQERGLTRDALAERAGLSRRFLAQVESGRGNIALTRLAGLCAALDVPLEVLTAGLAQGASSSAPAAGPAAALLPELAECTPSQIEELRSWLAQRLGNRGRVTALIGLRGAGKTTLGRRASIRLRCPFVELDDLVEKRAGLPLRDIFEVQGEEIYRRHLHEALVEHLASDVRSVLAVAGSIVARPDSYEALLRGANTIWLKASPEDHWNRVLRQDPRPMARYPRPYARLQELLREREPLYARARWVIDTSSTGIDAGVRQVVAIARSAAADAGGIRTRRAARARSRVPPSWPSRAPAARKR